MSSQAEGKRKVDCTSGRLLERKFRSLLSLFCCVAALFQMQAHM